MSFRSGVVVDVLGIVFGWLSADLIFTKRNIFTKLPTLNPSKKCERTNKRGEKEIQEEKREKDVNNSCLPKLDNNT